MQIRSYFALLFAAAALAGPALASDEGKPAKSPCPPKSKVFDGVYHHQRLKPLDTCRRAADEVMRVLKEDDGDLHLEIGLDRGYSRLINSVNRDKKHGWLVVEFMPRDGGHLPKPKRGEHLALLGAWVADVQRPGHGWNELHPVWSVTLKGKTYASGPQFGGNADSDRSSNAAENCRTETGARCIGF